MKLMKQDDTSPWYNFLLWGVGGSGKTTCGVTAPAPVLFLQTEKQGFAHVLQAAAMLDRPVPTVLEMASLEDFHAVYEALTAALASGSAEFTLPGVGTLPTPKSVVVDSLGDLNRIIANDIQTPEKERSHSFWQKLGTRMRGVLIRFRDLPCNVIFLCAEEERQLGEGERSKVLIGPAVSPRTLVADCVLVVNAVGRMRRKFVRGGTDDEGNRLEERMAYGVSFAGPDNVALKHNPALEFHEPPDISAWIEKMTAATKKPKKGK